MTTSPDDDAPWGPTLFDRAVMGVDAALSDRVAAALAGKALQVMSAGRPSIDGERSAQAQWAYAGRVLSPSPEEVSRASWAVATLAEGPAAEYAAAGFHDEGAVTDAAIVAALDAVWPALAGG